MGCFLQNGSAERTSVMINRDSRGHSISKVRFSSFYVPHSVNPDRS
jgi:hypothetical protein